MILLSSKIPVCFIAKSNPVKLKYNCWPVDPKFVMVAKVELPYPLNTSILEFKTEPVADKLPELL